jgi:sarcosine oxidase
MHAERGGDFFYGFPISGGSGGVKVGSERYEVETTADAVDRGVVSEDAAWMYETHIAGRLGGLTPRVLRSVACLYTSTPDSHFLIDPHPDMSGVLVVSCCSGHGFKHSAAIGEAIAQQITTGRSDLDLSAFRRDRLM